MPRFLVRLRLVSQTVRSLALVTLALETLAVLVTRNLAPTLLDDRTHVPELWHIPAQPVNENVEREPLQTRSQPGHPASPPVDGTVPTSGIGYPEVVGRWGQDVNTAT